MDYTQTKSYTLSGMLVVGLSAIVYIYYKRKHHKHKNFQVQRAIDAFNYLQIHVVTSQDACDGIVMELRRRCAKHQALGFDCEWVTDKSGRHPVSLLQLSTYDGYCALFRLNLMHTVPQVLIDLLTDKNIYKVGVAPHDDVKYVRGDYGILLQSTLDLRFLVEKCGDHAAGLGPMTHNILHIALDKSWKIRCSNWEAPELTHAQIHYAASDAHAAILIFVTSMETIHWRHKLWNPCVWSRDVWDRVHDICHMYADMPYKVKHGWKKEKIRNKTNKPPTTYQEKKRKDYSSLVRSKPLYDNCYLHAPDGELLCTCDTKKALWYVDKQLADVISTDPMSVQLRFEPAGRSVGDVGRYYQIEKENKCVVCGVNELFIRKNVIPREYRKHFPELMKDHSSHDILLLCLTCHRRSNAADQSLRDALAVKCNAPLMQNKPYAEDPICRTIRSAARALLVHSHKKTLPDERRKELERIVLQHYSDHDVVTEELLQEASKLTVLNENKDYTESHGPKVVAHYLKEEGGLLALETLWRQHFLDVMRPQYLPPLWSIKHNEERLKVKYEEGRINDNDLKTIGLKDVKWKVKV